MPAVGAALTVLFIFGRVTAMLSNAGYRPSFSARVYLEHAYRFLGFALYDPWWLTPWVAAAIALAVAAYAVWRGSPALRLAVAWMAIGILPVAFIEQRGLDAVYIPALALALAIALGIRRLRGQRWSSRPCWLCCSWRMTATAAWIIRS